MKSLRDFIKYQQIIMVHDRRQAGRLIKKLILSLIQPFAKRLRLSG